MYITLIVRQMAENHSNYTTNLFTTKQKAINFIRKFAYEFFNEMLSRGYINIEENMNTLEKYITLKNGQYIFKKSVSVDTLDELFEQFSGGVIKWFISDNETPL